MPRHSSAQTCLEEILDFWFFSHCSPLGRYWMGFGRPEKLRAHVLQVTKVSMTTCLAHIEPRLWSWPNFSQIWENLKFCRQSVQKLTDSTQHSESSWNIEIGTMAKQCTLEPWPTELFFLFCMCLSFGTKFGRIQWGWFFSLKNLSMFTKAPRLYTVTGLRWEILRMAPQLNSAP